MARKFARCWNTIKSKIKEQFYAIKNNRLLNPPATLSTSKIFRELQNDSPQRVGDIFVGILWTKSYHESESTLVAFFFQKNKEQDSKIGRNWWFFAEVTEFEGFGRGFDSYSKSYLANQSWFRPGLRYYVAKQKTSDFEIVSGSHKVKNCTKIGSQKKTKGEPALETGLCEGFVCWRDNLECKT
jgi:hypothetical protein